MSRETTSSASFIKQIVSNIWNNSSINDGPDCSEYEPTISQNIATQTQPENGSCSDECESNAPSTPSSECSQYCSQESKCPQTENGAPSYCTTEDPRLDLFFKTVRGITNEDLVDLLEKSWTISPRDTLRTMFYVRDCRGGKGERKIFWDFMSWLYTKEKGLFEKNLPCVPYYGSFKDFRKMTQFEAWGSEDQEKEKMIISYWCDVLQKDIVELNHDRGITLAAKWVPIQDSRFCREMGLSHKFFRKTVRFLRDRLDIVECKMSAGDWDKILFERVCSLSMKRYSSVFRKHCEEKFVEYLLSVQKGEKKMNVGQLYPSDIASQFLYDSTNCDEQTLNVAWEQLLLKTRNSLSQTKKKFLCVVDTSGSMNGTPMNVAVGLGLFLSELYPESKFYRRFITFSNQPELQQVEGETLKERIQTLSRANWNMNTDLQKVFDLVLTNSTPEDHPEVLIILSDMQFDRATTRLPQCGQPQTDLVSTNLSVIEERYKEAGIKRPRLIYWNLRANTIDFPATTDVSDCGLVSGYSTSLLDSFLEDGDINPMSLFRKTIDSSRYDMVYTSF